MTRASQSASATDTLLSARPGKTAPSGEERLRALFHTRYRGTELPSSARTNAVIETILSHRSVRHYLSKPLPDGVIETLVAAAQSAPTSSNLQAFSVVAVQDPDRRARLAALAGDQQHIIQAPLLFVWLADFFRLRSVAGRVGRSSIGLDYVETFLIAVIDAALAAQNAVVALESLGLGACYIGAFRNDPEGVSAELGLPPETIAVFGLTVGYPDPARLADVKPRLPQEIVLHRERYDQALQSALLNDYNQALRAFQAEQSLPQIDWTEQAAARVATPEALKGRHRLKQTIRRLGFALR